MPVTCKKASLEWKRAFKEFEELSGFEILYQCDIDSGEITPQEAWNLNIEWFENLLAACSHIQTPTAE